MSWRGGGNENHTQIKIVEYLNNMSGIKGRFFRIKNTGTFDPTRGVFRRFNGVRGLPDILGVKMVVIDGKIVGRFVAIEVKKLDSRGRLGAISKDQVEVLKSLHDLGCIVGIACDIYDAMEIITDDPYLMPRKDRTFGNRKLREYIAKGTAHEKRKAEDKDPLSFLYKMEYERNKDKS